MSNAIPMSTDLAQRPSPARVRALQDASARLTSQITAQRAVLELAQAQGDEDESELALVEITLAVHARSMAQQHLERLGVEVPEGRPGLGPESDAETLITPTR